MAKQRKQDRPSRRTNAPRPEPRVTHPENLEELEEAAQTDVGEPDEAIGEPVDEAHPGMAFADEEDRRPSHDSGLSIDPEDLGRQFLADATEQDNFESEWQAAGGEDVGRGPALGSVISESTLETAGQEDREIPGSRALGHENDEYQRNESFTEDVDLLSNVIREASLFDQPTERGGTRSPRVESDETEPSPENPEAREREAAEAREHLRHHRDAGALRATPPEQRDNRGTPPARGTRTRSRRAPRP